MNVADFIKMQLNNIRSLKDNKHRDGAYIALLDTLRYLAIHEPWYTDLYMKVRDEYDKQ